MNKTMKFALFSCDLSWAYFLCFLLFASPSFSAPSSLGQNVTLFGDAFIDNNSIKLTQARSCGFLPRQPATSSTTSFGVGRSFYVNPIRFLDTSINSAASFSCRFSFIIVSSPSCPFGDGLAFLITNNINSLSIDDGCIGLPEETKDQDTFIAIEFDTSYNREFGDINGNHVGVDVNQVKSLASVDVVSRGIDLKGGREMTAWIEYRHLEKMIRVWVGYTQVRPLTPILVTRVDLSVHFKEFMHVGFSASNGRGSTIHIVHSWRFKTFWFRSSKILPLDIVEEGDCVMCFPEDASNSDASPESMIKRKLHLILILGGPAGFIVLVIATFVLVCLHLRRKRRRNRQCSQDGIAGFHQNRVPKYFSLSEIKEATKGFNPDKIIGEGASAVVYEGEIPSVGYVAVKRFNQPKRISLSQNKFDSMTRIPFDNEFATMVCCLRHKHLVQLKGWCCERNELVLVYEYMANGSLHKILHRHTSITKFLTWERRLNILLGVAYALIYLHEECANQIIHRDVKTCNILLDEELNAKLGDFGLAEVYSDSPTTRDATLPVGTMGYLAPEYAFSGVPTVKTDVYSFGVVVLEVVSGRRPVDDDIMLTDWLWNLWEMGIITEAADPKLLRGRFNKGDMEKMLILGLWCVHPDHEKRPTMREVAQMLKGEKKVPQLPQKKPTVRIQSVLPEIYDDITNPTEELEGTPWSTPKSQFSRT